MPQQPAGLTLEHAAAMQAAHNMGYGYHGGCCMLDVHAALPHGTTSMPHPLT